MHGFQFVTDGTPTESALTGYYDPLLVALSLAIAVVASYAAFRHIRLIRSVENPVFRLGWHFSGAVTLGAGVWAMHFLGMEAFILDMPIAYNPILTLLSMLPAIFAGFITLYILCHRPTLRAIFIGGVLMGGGIGLMHYTGMMAMIMSVEMFYRPGLFALSIISAIVMATLALMIQPLLSQYFSREWPVMMASSVVMGLAISSMHYVAMGATVYIPLAAPQHSELVVQSEWMKWLQVGVAIFILTVSTVVIQLRHRLRLLEQQAADSNQRADQLSAQLQTITARMPGVVFQIVHSSATGFRLTYASEAATTLFKIDPRQASARDVLRQAHPADRSSILHSLQQSALSGEAWQCQFRINDPGCEHIPHHWVMISATPENRTQQGLNEQVWNGFAMDITERKQAEDTIERLAYYDVLTGLPNRRLLLNRLDHAIENVERSHEYGALFFIDLDGFKRLNDLQGHAVGDRLLQNIAERLTASVRTVDSVARLGGDEFVICMERFSNDERSAVSRAEQVARKLITLMNTPFDLDGFSYQCAASIGVTLFDSSINDSEQWLTRADMAMYEAKQSGNNVIRFFDPKMQQAMEARFNMENELRAALTAHEFVLFLQNQVDSKGRVVGAEALLRWFHPSKGEIQPSAFIPLAEDTGLIVPIGGWVLNAACLQLQQWQTRPETEDLCLSVNISARQFHQPDFVERIKKTVNEHGIKPKNLKLELTESVVLQDIEETTDKVNRLKAFGIRFAMDDFGTGYSSLSYLSKLPFDEVKIDKSFILSDKTLGHDKDWIIVDAIISIGHDLGMEVIAEGVETLEQLTRLKQSRCERFQGFYYHKPVLAAEWQPVSEHCDTDDDEGEIRPYHSTAKP